MTLLKCGTHIVADVPSAIDRFTRWLDYRVVEQGRVPEALAAAWQAPNSAGRPYAVLAAASGEPIFLRLIEGDDVPAYQPIRTYGWAAIELCVTDVEAANDKMLPSPFEIIGPPKTLDGSPLIRPMQVRGPDREIIYLTQIMGAPSDQGLPTATSLIDCPFIIVHACADLRATAKWVEDVLGFDLTDFAAIQYSMINRAFGLPATTKHELVAGMWKGQTFLEFDQYPDAATVRPRHEGALPPGVAICTIEHPDFARFDAHWLAPPQRLDGAIYDGRRVGTLKTPDGALLEVIERDAR